MLFYSSFFFLYIKSKLQKKLPWQLILRFHKIQGLSLRTYLFSNFFLKFYFFLHFLLFLLLLMLLAFCLFVCFTLQSRFLFLCYHLWNWVSKRSSFRYRNKKTIFPLELTLKNFFSLFTPYFTFKKLLFTFEKCLILTSVFLNVFKFFKIRLISLGQMLSFKKYFLLR